jgi:hypothetical protein
MKREWRQAMFRLLLVAVYVLLPACEGTVAPSSQPSVIQVRAEATDLSNDTWVSVEANLTPLSDEDAVLDCISVTVGVFVPACGHNGCC